MSLTNKATIGQAVVAALQRPAETANHYLSVESVNTTQNTILAEPQRVTGTAWDVTRSTREAQVQVARATAAEGDFRGMATLVLASTYGAEAGLRADCARDERLANGLLALPPESVQETVEAGVGH